MKLSPTSPYVLAFAEVMERKLAANRRKGNREGWIKDHVSALLQRLQEEVDELHDAIRGETDDIAGECADVANFAMMIADVCGGLHANVTHEIEWHKLLALVMAHAGQIDVRLTGDDIRQSGVEGQCVVVAAEDEGRTLRLRLVAQAEADRMQSEFQASRRARR